MKTFRWTRTDVEAIAKTEYPVAPVFTRQDVDRPVPDLDIWDHWPVLVPDGRLAAVDDGLLIIALSAPFDPDPEQRHGRARLRLFHRAGSRWRDLGPLLPDGFSPGSREWAGSAVWERERRRMTLLFTAAGHRGEGGLSFDQRLFACEVALDADLMPTGWSDLSELVRPDGTTYGREFAGGGGLGTIKAFRDPFLLPELAGRTATMVFTGSGPAPSDDYNGLVGSASLIGETWQLGTPWVDATGVNNELERPHVIAHDGRLYLFWSTQAKVFAPKLRFAPTGLYGVVADRLGEPWRQINGHGIVFANPPEAPFQAYSWQVLPTSACGVSPIWSTCRVPLKGRRRLAATSSAHRRRRFA